MQRRQLLQIASGAAITLLLPVSEAIGQSAPNSGPEVPLLANEPWRTAGNKSADWRINALSYALLAPNPHNLQPWVADLKTPNQIGFYYDVRRTLPMTDPMGRQLLIGCGCFLELLELAANAMGVGLETTLFAEGTPTERSLDSKPIAILKRTAMPKRSDPLFAQIRSRRSSKVPYDMARALPVNALSILQQSIATLKGVKPEVGLTQESASSQLESLKTIIWDAWLVEATTARTHKESVDLMRIGSDEVIANPDGIALGSPFIDRLKKAGQITREAMLDPNSAGNKMGQQRYKAMMAATPAMLWINTKDNSRHSQLAAGRAYARVALAATELGLSLHPVSQALQEFPEMADHLRKTHQTLKVDNPSRVQMLARIGFGPAVEPAPRKPVNSLIKTAV